ncbi:hypothetical protein I3760_07G052700 [Carya illinoinensis]|nr:hypothetical protein I3760_07G052700 [Carya illinoinensis]
MGFGVMAHTVLPLKTLCLKLLLGAASNDKARSLHSELSRMANPADATSYCCCRDPYFPSELSI